jgi:hypothetical protein
MCKKRSEIRANNAYINEIFISIIYLINVFICSPGKENLPPIIITPRHSIDSISEQGLPGIFIFIDKY